MQTNKEYAILNTYFFFFFFFFSTLLPDWYQTSKRETLKKKEVYTEVKVKILDLLEIPIYPRVVRNPFERFWWWGHPNLSLDTFLIIQPWQKEASDTDAKCPWQSLPNVNKMPTRHVLISDMAESPHTQKADYCFCCCSKR